MVGECAVVAVGAAALALTRRDDRADVGQLDCLVTIKEPKRVVASNVDESFTPVETWTTLDLAWMARRDVSQSERYASHQLSSPCDTEWYLPYRSDMDPRTIDVTKKRKLEYEGRSYDITSARLGDRADRRQIILSTLSGGTAT